VLTSGKNGRFCDALDFLTGNFQDSAAEDIHSFNEKTALPEKPEGQLRIKRAVGQT
jgi:hypothetical protein